MAVSNNRSRGEVRGHGGYSSEKNQSLENGSEGILHFTE